MRAKWAAPQGDIDPERLFKVVLMELLMCAAGADRCV
jgi:hypothetical protein